MSAIMFTGSEKTEGGRVGDAASLGLSAELRRLGFRLSRLKTGTPPRLHKDSIDWSQTEPQPGDAIPRPFSFYHQPNPFPFLPQISCHITYTNERTHEIIEANFDRCFQVMECDDPVLFQDWISSWDDLMEFEVIPVVPSAQTKELILSKL